jgi:hypothetical protein
MPLLDPKHVAEMLANARNTKYSRVCMNCHRYVVKDYCRSCDEFYFTHAPGCTLYHDHTGHRLTLVPFVEVTVTMKDRLMDAIYGPLAQ